MKERREFIEFKGTKLSYLVFGTGKIDVVCFHGYGQDATIYLHAFSEELKQHYRVISVDLFGHGASDYFKGNLSSSLWGEILNVILSKENVTRFSIVGFSMGGRVAIHSVLNYEDRIDQILLLAPDGIVESSVFKLATRHPVFRHIFKHMVFYPKFYAVLLVILGKLHFLDKRTYDLFMRILDKRTRRLHLFRVWQTYSGLCMTFKEAIDKVVPVTQVFLAKKDRLVKNREVVRYCRDLGVEVEELDVNHFGLVEHVLKSNTNRFARLK